MIFLFLIIACVWLFGQFAYSVGVLIALGCIALYLVIALLNKAMDSKASSKFFSWATKTRTNSILTIVAIVLCLILTGVFIGASQLNDYDISWKSAVWSTDESFIGIEYDEKHLGALVTNSSNKTVTVNIKAEFYDSDNNYLKTSGNNWTGAIAPSGSRFVEIDLPEDAERYKIVLAEQKKVKDYVAVTAGFDSGCDVVFSIDEEENDMIIQNNTNQKIEACGCMYVYYNADGDISYIQTFSAGDIPAKKKVAEYFKLTEPSFEYESKEVIFFAFYEK